MSGEGLHLDEDYKRFLEIVCQECSDVEACEAQAKCALAVVADWIRLGRTEMKLEIPVGRLQPNGQKYSTVLFDRGESVYPEAYQMVISIPDGGCATIMNYACGDHPFSESEQNMQKLLFREIFNQYSRAAMRQMLNRILATDMATGVANQESLIQFAGQMIQKQQIQQYVVLFFNIHNFKYVNKVFSYDQGDILLRKYAQMVQNMLTEEEILARMGGDNFVALVKREHSEAFLKQLRNMRLYHKNAGKEKTFVFGVTAGVSSLEGVEEPREVMARSSIAYQAARQRSAGTVIYYSPEVRQNVMQAQSIVSNFVPALEAEEFVVYYQPKVSISEHRICGAEALVRWMRNGKLIPPMEFIPQLEREGSVCKLDYYVLEQACKFIRRQLEQGKPVVRISVNFSRRHLDEDDLVEQIVGVIDRYGIDHSYIEIELTESEDFQNYEIMSEVVNGLRAHGIGTSIDDFGTGFSSLNMIKRVDLNVIKIDKSFIPLKSEYPDKKRDMVMFQGIVSLVNQLGKKTIAEGVETAEQLEYLKSVGCDIVQGYVFDRPLPQPEFEQRLQMKCYA